jgi:hypothetical protein
MVVLTEELVLQKTRSEDLATVRNLNLWGSDLSDVSILAVSTTPGGLCPCAVSDRRRVHARREHAVGQHGIERGVPCQSLLRDF